MISTKDIPTGGGKALSKTLQPGNRVIKINSIYLEKYAFGQNAYHLMLDCEGPDLGENFEGFFIDKDNESLGRHKGQVSRVRASEYAYEDKILESGVQINRDIEIVKMLKNICVATDCLAWFEAEDGKHETIESLVQKMNEDAPYADTFMSTCLAGKEYENKQGYTNHDLFFPKFTKAGVPFENAEVETSISRVYKFNDKDHIRAKKAPKQVASFDGAPSQTGGSEFEL